MPSGTYTADAVTLSRRPRLLLANAVIFKTVGRTFVANATIVAPGYTGLFDANATITVDSLGGTFSANATILSGTLPTLPGIPINNQGVTFQSDMVGIGSHGRMVILYDNIDITAAVIFNDAFFITSVSGRPGSFHFRVKDVAHTFNFVPGKPIDLYVDTEHLFTGFSLVVSHKYAFPVDITTNPEVTPRIWELEGPDINILFAKRFVYDQDSPSAQLPLYPPGKSDKAIIEDLVANMLNLEGDGITLDLQNVGSPNPDFKGSVADIGMSWGMAMTFIAQLPGGIFYLTPDRVLKYVDDDTIDAPYDISDVPQPYIPPFFFPGVTWQDDGIPSGWQANTAYTYPQAITESGFIFAVDADGTSGPTIPDFSGGGFVGGDGTVNWNQVGEWFSTFWSLDSMVIPVGGNGHVYRAIVAGESGPTEPIFPTDGGSVVDGDGGIDPGSIGSTGYSGFTWTYDGARMVNDAQVWGAGTGSSRVVYGHYEDDDSIEEHGRWQLPGQYRWDVFRQATADKIARSLVLGSPQNLRGAKDPQPQVVCRIKRLGLQAGMKVNVINDVFGLDEVIPLRKVKMSFPTPHDIFFDLELSHEIDAPWSYAEFLYPRFNFPGFPPFPPFIPIIPPHDGSGVAWPVCSSTPLSVDSSIGWFGWVQDPSDMNPYVQGSVSGGHGIIITAGFDEEFPPSGLSFEKTFVDGLTSPWRVSGELLADNGGAEIVFLIQNGTDFLSVTVHQITDEFSGWIGRTNVSYNWVNGISFGGGDFVGDSSTFPSGGGNPDLGTGPLSVQFVITPDTISLGLNGSGLTDFSHGWSTTIGSVEFDGYSPNAIAYPSAVQLNNLQITYACSGAPTIGGAIIYSGMVREYINPFPPLELQLSSPYALGSVQVFVGGVALVPGVDFVETDPEVGTITFLTQPGDDIEVVYYAYLATIPNPDTTGYGDGGGA